MQLIAPFCSIAGISRVKEAVTSTQDYKTHRQVYHCGIEYTRQDKLSYFTKSQHENFHRCMQKKTGKEQLLKEKWEIIVQYKNKCISIERGL